MKVKISKTEVYASGSMCGGSAGKPMRPVSIADTYGMGKPTRTNPVGGFIAMHCYGGPSDQKKSPTTPGVTGFKKRFY
jgi:hypothetical protein